MSEGHIKTICSPWQIEFVVTKDGVEIFRKKLTVKIDNEAPVLTVLKNDAYDKMTYFEYAKETVVLLKDNVTFPFSFQVELNDENIVEDTLEVCESDVFEFDLGELFGFSKNAFEEELEKAKKKWEI